MTVSGKITNARKGCPPQPPRPQMATKRRKDMRFVSFYPYFCGMKYVLLPLGCLSLACGIAGIFVPLLPTTPFLLLAAALFFRSSPRAYAWLLNHKLLGPYIRDFRETRSMPLRAKVIALSLLWLTSLHCFFIILDHWALKTLMAAVAVGVTAYLLSLKTKRKKDANSA